MPEGYPDKLGPCLEWSGATKNDNRPYRKHNKKNIYIHREEYEKAYGPIPEGMVVRHKCDNTLCVRLSHLELGTQKDNIEDMWNRGRAITSYGENHGRTHLSEDDVRYIRKTYRKYSRNANLITLGKQFGIDPSVVKDIVDMNTWKHVC